MVTSHTKKSFWIGLSTLACASLLFCYKYFPIANPFVDITISIDRTEAIEKSKELAEHYEWPLEGANIATYFGTEQQDRLLQPFADLESGGNDTYRALIKDGLYCPYNWYVRFFRQHSPDEVFVFLTPEGNPYGFNHSIPEDKELPSLTEDAARKLAQEQAKTIWNIDFGPYKEIESSHDTKPNGRIDYSFVYERTDIALKNDGKYRLTLNVSGNQLTTIKHSIKIPEQFQRKFESLYSQNNFLAGIATFLMYFLYIVGGCLGGGYFLFRRNMLFARNALMWGSIIAFLQLLSSLNNLPLIWMSYQTSVSFSSFLSSYAIGTLFHILQLVALCAFAFSIATSLDNWAFPNHARFWNVWSKNNGSSYTILGQTIGGYLGSILFLGSATATYVLFLKVFKWWSPTNPLVDPNILATYFPWISPFAMAFQAGFLEECLFRAIPLAGAVIIGKHLNKERLFIIGGFLLQAFIFAAAHANYPQQPSYFRLLEIFLPAIFFGVIYFFYGLLPGVICHFFYDFILMSMPLWITASASSSVQKLLLVILGFIPLIIVLIRRLQKEKWTKTLEHNEYNDGPIGRIVHEEHTAPQNITHKKHLPRQTVWIMGGLTAISLALLFFCKQGPYDAAEMRISRTQAIALAKQHLPEDFVFAQHYDVLTELHSGVTPEHIFVWQTSGKETYQRLLGTYLAQPLWNVRFVSFIAPQDVRAEEYDVLIGPDGSVIGTNHRLPEQKALPSLNKAEARGVALQGLMDRYGVSPLEVEEISAQPTDRPNRTDWTFVFKHTPTMLNDGYANISIIISGPSVTSGSRSIFIPESWQRDFVHKESVKSNIRMACSLLFILLIVIAISSFGTGFLRKPKIKSFILFALTLFILLCLTMLDSIPALTGSFSTAQPFSTQLFMVLTTTLILSLIRIILVSSYTVHMRAFTHQSQLISPIIFFVGLTGGLLLRAAHVLGKWLIPINIPVWGSYEFMDSYSTFFMLAMTYTFLILRNVTFGTIAVSSLNNLKECTRNSIFRFVFIFVATYASIGTFETVASGIVIGLSITAVALLLYHLLLAYDSTLWIPILTGYFLTYALGEFSSYVFPGYAVGITCVASILTGINCWWFYRIRKNA